MFGNIVLYIFFSFLMYILFSVVSIIFVFSNFKADGNNLRQYVGIQQELEVGMCSYTF